MLNNKSNPIHSILVLPCLFGEAQRLAVPYLTILASVKVPVGVGDFKFAVHYKRTLCDNGLSIFFPAKQNNVDAVTGGITEFNCSFLSVKFNEFSFLKFGIVNRCIVEGKKGSVLQFILGCD